MPKRKSLGAHGENLGAEYLLTKGYKILHRNWRHGKKEIDIIAATGVTLVFVEIKTRSGNKFGTPEEAVNLRKQVAIKETAAAYINLNVGYKYFRFDVLSIVIQNGDLNSIVHYEDAFY